MCRNCWEEFDCPKIDTPRVREAAAAIRDVYEHNCVGGHLHIVVDDWNLGDDNLKWCGGAIAKNLHHAGREQLACEARCFALLRALTEDERASALALYDGFWDDETHLEDLT